MANATLTRFFKCSMRDRRPGARAGRLPGAGWALRHAACRCVLAARDKHNGCLRAALSPVRVSASCTARWRWPDKKAWLLKV